MSSAWPCRPWRMSRWRVALAQVDGAVHRPRCRSGLRNAARSRVSAMTERTIAKEVLLADYCIALYCPPRLSAAKARLATAKVRRAVERAVEGLDLGEVRVELDS